MAKKKNIFSLLVFIVLLILLIGMPLGSWYYLNSGLEFRKGLEVETKVKGSFDTHEMYKSCLEEGSDFSVAFANKTVILGSLNNKNIEALRPIKDQYEKVPNFEVCLIGSAIDNPDDFYSFLNCSYQSDDLILLNNKMEIIDHYSTEELSLKKLIQHVAVVLPRAKSRDIVVKNK